MGKTRKDNFRFDPKPKFKKQKRENNNRGFMVGELDPGDGEEFDPYDDPADLEENDEVDDDGPAFYDDDDESDRIDLDE